jgi:hypothetical protein
MKPGDSVKRMVIRLYSREVITLMENLPRGFRSLVVESALTAFLDSDNGRVLLTHLGRRRERSRTPPETKGGAKEKNGLMARLKGDF